MHFLTLDKKFLFKLSLQIEMRRNIPERNRRGEIRKQLGTRSPLSKHIFRTQFAGWFLCKALLFGLSKSYRHQQTKRYSSHQSFDGDRLDDLNGCVVGRSHLEIAIAQIVVAES
jgi:hypothetical protein